MWGEKMFESGRGEGPGGVRRRLRLRGAGRAMGTGPGGAAGRSLLGKPTFWTTVVLPATAAVVRDLISEDSRLKQIAGSLRARIEGRLRLLPRPAGAPPVRVAPRQPDHGGEEKDPGAP